MIEIKFSQGAKPGHGGILPKEKVTDEIAAIRLVSEGYFVSTNAFGIFNTFRTNRICKIIEKMRRKTN